MSQRIWAARLIVNSKYILCEFVVILTLVSFCGYECFAWGNKYEESSNYRAALAALDKDDINSGYDYLKKEIAIHPDNGYAYLYLSTVLYEYADYHSALKTINASLTYLPDNDRVTRAKAFLLRSKTERVLKMWNVAMSDLNEALSLCPKDIDILQERADLYHILGEYDQSDADYRRILGIHPGYAYAEMGMGAIMSAEDVIVKLLINSTES